jgi:acetoin utilization deacetylase AcuC-like enzyme
MLAVHDAAYLERAERVCADGFNILDTPDCVVCPKTFELARLSAGGVVAAVDDVAAGRSRNAFAAVRPPGHHAERDRAMGFCFLGNVAIAARRLQRRHGIERVLIFDFDVHHGNGTQHIFERDPTVFFCSVHEDPRYLYPGTGFAHETGIGPGEGATLNLPLLPGGGDEEYKRTLSERLVAAARRFQPQFVLVSAGFDAHRRDPIAHMEVTVAGFVWMTELARDIAREFAGGRLVSVLEGGYDLDALKECVAAHLHVLAATG